VKVGDLVRFNAPGGGWDDERRRLGIIASFDEDNDPEVIWSHPSFRNWAEPNFRAHLVVLSEM